MRKNPTWLSDSFLGLKCNVLDGNENDILILITLKTNLREKSFMLKMLFLCLCSMTQDGHPSVWRGSCCEEMHDVTNAGHHISRRLVMTRLPTRTDIRRHEGDVTGRITDAAGFPSPRLAQNVTPFATMFLVHTLPLYWSFGCKHCVIWSNFATNNRIR